MINEESGWVIESINAEYANISICNPLSESSYTEIHHKLKNSRKGLINIQNNENKCFPWYHIRHLNPLKTHSERMRKADKNMANDLDYEGIEFRVSKRDYCKIIVLVYPV